jgi:hypothetical protein
MGVACRTIGVPSVQLSSTLLACIVLQLPLSAWAAVSVSPGGQAGYSQAIAVPPGIAGMAPNLAFSYTDGGINGPLGVGWSVQGISTVTRCPASKPTDGFSRAVFFDTADKLCLDGQRLIQTDESGLPTAAANLKGIPVGSQVNDAQGLDNNNLAVYREFRTEKDSFARIRAYGSVAGDASKGPAYFKVWTKSGQIYHYGRLGSDSQSLMMANPSGDGVTLVAAVWAAHRISDTLGNFIDFKYAQREVAWGSGPTAQGRNGREWNIAEIQYTGAPGQAPANKIVFEYDERPADAAPGHDRAEAYQRAGKNVNVQRLIAIRSYVGIGNATPVPVRVHKLVYERSPASGRSRLTHITECAGSNESVCLPSARFSYTDGGKPDFTASSAFTASPMAELKMLDATDGKYGALTGDFNGDGRTDVLRWSTTASLNELHLSNGDGSFTKNGQFNITADQLFTTSGCYYTLVSDFNGDGLSDLLRATKPGCSPNINIVFLSVGDGSFRGVSLQGGIDLTQTLATRIDVSGQCLFPQRRPGSGSRLPAGDRPETDPPAPADELSRMQSGPTAGTPGTSAGCIESNRREGRNYHLLDVDGDGFTDLVTSLAPGFYWNSGWGPVPKDADICAGLVEALPPPAGGCTKVYRGQGDGRFVLLASASNISLYTEPPSPGVVSNPYWRRPAIADVNGDGLPDILTRYAGVWRSNGNGSFTAGSGGDGSATCNMPIDFNGDGRADCLRADANPAAQNLSLHYSASTSGVLAQFNINTTGNHLYARDSKDRQTIGMVAEDFNGDGRTDILRWGQATADNGLYFSKGDGSFHSRVSAGLQGISRPLQGVDGKTGFMLGDFLGNGTLQILHLKHAPTRSAAPAQDANQLYVRNSGGLPADLLASHTSSSGLVSTVGPRVTLSNSGGAYLGERGTPQAGQGQVVDLQAPMHVITSLSQDTGAGSVVTRYLYKGLKAERGGRGMLGFREVRQQSPAPDGSLLTVATEYVHQHPYIGVAARTQTHLGGLDLSGPRLSRTTYSYCDKTSPNGALPIPDPPVPTESCGTAAKVTRPYVYQSVEEGWDLSGLPLPRLTTTNTYNASLDPTTIIVSTTGTALGLPQTFTKTTRNSYFPDQTANEQWILARLQRSTVQSQVPNSLPAIATSAGRSPQASAQNGSTPASSDPEPPPAISPAALSAVLQLLLED